MKKLEVDSIHVSTRFSGNGRPRSGWATFSDGKEYEWHEWEDHPPYIRGGVVFYKRWVMYPDAPPGCRGSMKVSFKSTKRAEALKRFLDVH